MEDKRRQGNRPPTAADAFTPPPTGARSKAIMLTVVAIAAVCAVVVLVAVSWG